MSLTGWPVQVNAVLQTLQKGGFEAFLVGGCVRDTLLGRVVHDFDVATNARPEQVVSLFPHTIPTGLQHGTVTVLSDGIPVEVTTYRIDVGYTDGRRPDSVVFTQRIEDDLARRDFTMNAMAMNVQGDIIDPFAGRRDLQNGLIRTVGDAEARFCEDGLRILRAIRFGADLSFDIESRTLTAMTRQASRLRSVSTERIGQEVAKIASSDWWRMAGLLADGPFLDVLPHPFSQLRRAFTRLADLPHGPALLKVEWNTCLAGVYEDEDARQPALAASVAFWFFLANLEPSTAGSMARPLAWSRQWSRNIQETAEWLYRDPGVFDGPGWRRAIYESHLLCLHTACAILDFWNVVHNRPPSLLSSFERAVELQPIFSLRDLSITGRELLELGFSGPTIGRVKRSLVAAVLAGELPNESGALRAAAKTVATRQPFIGGDD